MRSRPGRSGNWLSRLGGISLAALVLSVVAVRSEANRTALWRVVESCVLDHEMTGVSLPCLDVEAAGGDDRGFVILKPPFGDADTILSPMRRIVGLEDPWLRNPEAPNYFADAWESRKWLPAGARGLAHSDIALAVNSPLVRSQDQLHIHMGCASPQTRQVLQSAVGRLSAERWTLLKGVLPGADVWARLQVQDTLAGVNIFQLAADEVPDPLVQRNQSGLAIAGVTLGDGRNGFVLMAAHALPFVSRDLIKAESFVDSSCRRE